MDEEFQLTMLYAMAFIGVGLYLVYLLWFLRTLENFRHAPFSSACAWLAMVGVLMFVGWMITMGQLSFDIATPWGAVPSPWVGALLAIVSLGARQVDVAHKRRKRRSDGISRA